MLLFKKHKKIQKKKMLAEVNSRYIEKMNNTQQKKGSNSNHVTFNEVPVVFYFDVENFHKMRKYHTKKTLKNDCE